LKLTDTNVTLAVALTMVDPIAYPSLSRARKAIRNGNVLLIRSSDSSGAEGGEDDNNETNKSNTLCLGKAADRVVPFDRICIQVRMGNGTNFKALRHAKPPFDVPVVYEDDHCALVNKPAGVITFRQGSSGNGFLSVRAALPFVLQPPTRGTHAVLRRPASVHRLDKPTSGLLCVVKTKPAMVHLSQQFHDRRVQKTYTAIVNGIPEERSEASVTSEEAAKFGIDPSQYPADTRWQVLESHQDDKIAVTVWRAVRYVKSLHARDGYLTLVELKPRTGRFHQLRRHLAWDCQRAIVGDSQYDGGTPSALRFRDRGLFLCASAVTHEHPYYNTVEGRRVWEHELDETKKYAGGLLWYSEKDDRVMLSARIELPDKFHKLLAREEERYIKLHDENSGK